MHSSNLIEHMPNGETTMCRWLVIIFITLCACVPSAVCIQITIGLSSNQINQSDGVASIINWKLDNNRFGSECSESIDENIRFSVLLPFECGARRKN